MTGEDFRYLHDQAVAEAKKRVAATDAQKAVAAAAPASTNVRQPASLTR